jgi:hydrophobic/amphiphilic exporter-1 (mainly G- bacteria), HAE1 family
MWLTRISIARPIFIIMLVAALLVLGVKSITEMPSEFYPRVQIPILTIITVYPGASPQDVESLVSKPLEEAVASVNRVKNIFSSSQENVSIVGIEFELGSNLDSVAADVREKVELAKLNLPKEINPPIVSKMDLNAEPVLYLGITGSQSSLELRRLAEDVIQYRLEKIPGVATIDVVGGDQREIQVNANRQKLFDNALTINDIINPLKAGNLNVPGGKLSNDKLEYSVRITRQIDSLDQIKKSELFPSRESIIAASFMENTPKSPLTAFAAVSNKPTATKTLFIGDLALVSDTVAQRDVITRLGGKDSVGLVIHKLSDANTMTVVDSIKRALDEIRPTLPVDLNVVTLQDQSTLVRESLQDVNVSLILGALLAVLVVFLFLHNLRGTAIVAVAIPTSIIATFIPMYFLGFTLNQMTLLALSLSIGILVDDSIVVLENIYRHLRQGESLREAAMNGRAEIGLAAITLTLVDVVVFVPIAFTGGIVGQFFREFGLTVAGATLFSLFVSFTLTPMMASRWYKSGKDLETKHKLFQYFDRFYSWLDSSYRRILEWALHRRMLVVSLGVIALILTGLYSWKKLGTEFTPPIDRGIINVTVEMPAGTALQATDDVMAAVEDTITHIPEVDNFLTNIGLLTGGFGSIPQHGSQYGQITLQLLDQPSLKDKVLHPFTKLPGKRYRSDLEVVEDLRRRFTSISGVHITVTPLRGWSSDIQPIVLQLFGQDLSEMSKVAEEVENRISKVPGVINPNVSVRVGQPEYLVHLDPLKLVKQGIDPEDSIMALRNSLIGNTDAKFHDKNRTFDIRVQLADTDRRKESDLAQIPIGSAKNKSVTVADAAEITESTGPTQIERLNRQRQIVVSADIAEGYVLGNLQTEIDKRFKDLPHGNVTMRWGGDIETLQENTNYMIFALVLSILLVYMLMAALFNSFLHPFTIMLSLPMALVGALLALTLTGETLNLVSMIGIIMLVGLVGKNAILLVDYTNTLRSRGMTRNKAILEASPTRLRPILMTTVAMIFAMIPVALRIGRASEIRAPMAIAVIGGLILSTLLTLIMIPVIYSLFDDLRGKSK